MNFNFAGFRFNFIIIEIVVAITIDYQLKIINFIYFQNYYEIMFIYYSILVRNYKNPVYSCC